MLRAYYASAEGLAERSVEYILSEYRRENLAKTRTPGRFAESLGAELLLIEALKKTGEVELPLDICTSAGGKPELRNGPCFSLSHSKGMVFCVLSDKPVGADVQRITAPEELLVRRCFSEKERIWLRAQEKGDKAFTMLWSLKESFAKLDGDGIAAIRSPRAELEIRGASFVLLAEPEMKMWYHVSETHVFSCCSRHYDRPEMLEEIIL